MCDAILNELITLDFIDNSVYKLRDLSRLEFLKESNIQKHAQSIYKEKNYPISLANRNRAK